MECIFRAPLIADFFILLDDVWIVVIIIRSYVLFYITGFDNERIYE